MGGLLTYLNPILQSLALLSVIVGIVFFLVKEWRGDNNKLDKATIDTLKENLAAEKLDKERLIREHAADRGLWAKEKAELSGRISSMSETLKKAEADIAMLKDLATGASAVKELKEILLQFVPILPMMPMFAKNDETILRLLNQLLDGQRESRGLIHEETSKIAEKIPNVTPTEK